MKCRVANGIESNELNRIFAIKGNCEKFRGHLCITSTLSSFHFFNKSDFKQYLFNVKYQENDKLTNYLK